MNVVSDSLKSGSALADDYINHFERVQELYEGHFRDLQRWQARAAWLDASEETRVPREALVQVLAAYNRKHNHYPQVEESLRQLQQPGTAVIVGGQQSGLFTGSMLVIYKAMTLVIAAREASEKLGRPVVPVFWIAGEDHDWDEVNHTYMMTPELEVTKVRMEAPAGPKDSVSHIPVTQQQWQEVLERIASLLPDSENKPRLIELLERITKQSGTLSDAFAGFLGELLGELGILLVDSADPALRQLEVSVFRDMIEQNVALSDAYRSAAARIEGNGYTLQAEVDPDGANLFYLFQGNRLLLTRQNDEFTDRRGAVRFTKQELLEELSAHPERFSNNVLTRPLMQDALFPVLCTVLGQGEISYWAITREAFPVLGLQMPIVLPRMSFTLLSATVGKNMKQFGLSFQDVQHRLSEARERWLEDQTTIQIAPRFEETRAALAAIYSPLIQELGVVSQGLVPIGHKNKEKILHQIDYLERKTRQALELQHEAALAQWQYIQVSLFPLEKPQERVYNVFYYMNRYGFTWLKDLMKCCTHYTEKHQILEM